MNVFNQ